MAWSEFIQKIGGPISLGLPFGVMWAYYGKWLTCLLYTSDAADERSSVDLGGRRIIKKKKQRNHTPGVCIMRQH